MVVRKTLNVLKILQANLIKSIPVFMFLGALYGYFIDPTGLKTWILPLTFLMVYPMMVTLNLKEVFIGGDGKVEVATQVINFIIIPLVGFALGRLFFPDNYLIALGLLLTSLLPTSGMTISWTGFAKGNIHAAIKMTVIGLVLGSLLTPLYLKLFMGAKIIIPIAGVFKQIGIVVFFPMLAGFITQQVLIKKLGMDTFKYIKPEFPVVSTVGVLGIVFVAIALKAKTIISDPILLIRLLIPLILLYGINFLISTLVGKYFFNRGDGIALVYGSVMRNLSIALAIAMTVFKEQGSEIAMIIALAYVIQVQAAAWYVKFTDKIFGEI
jgi:arsenite transporter